MILDMRYEILIANNNVKLSTGTLSHFSALTGLSLALDCK